MVLRMPIKFDGVGFCELNAVAKRFEIAVEMKTFGCVVFPISKCLQFVKETYKDSRMKDKLTARGIP